MGTPYKAEEIRLLQELTATSAANADSVSFSTTPVPEGKLRVVLAFGYYPSVNESQLVSIDKICKTGQPMGLINPVTVSLNPAIFTFIEQGMEYTLNPAEYIRVQRGNHTAGSTMVARMQFVDVDLPLYTYDEPQVVKRQQSALSSIRSRLGGVASSITRAPTDLGGERGGRGGPLEK